MGDVIHVDFDQRRKVDILAFELLAKERYKEHEKQSEPTKFKYQHEEIGDEELD